MVSVLIEFVLESNIDSVIFEIIVSVFLLKSEMISVGKVTIIEFLSESL